MVPPQQGQPRIGETMVQRFLPLTLAVVLLVAACGGSSDSGSGTESSEPTQTAPAAVPLELRMTAQFTCSQIKGTTAAAATPLITEALTKAATAGFAGPELREALRAACSADMVTLEADAEFNNLFGD